MSVGIVGESCEIMWFQDPNGFWLYKEVVDINLSLYPYFVNCRSKLMIISSMFTDEVVNRLRLALNVILDATK